MIRSPQAFLVSLSLHALMGMMILFVVAPKIVPQEEGEMKRCRIALSHVVPVVSEVIGHPVQKPLQKRLPEPDKTLKKPVTKPVPPKAVPVIKAPKPVVPSVPEVQEKAAVEPAIPETESIDAPTVGKAESEKTPSSAAEPADAVLPRQNRESYLDENLAVIARLLRENLYYPKLARKRHIEGEVLAAFTLQTDGTIQDVTVKKHAREVLDRAAVRTIESLSGRLPHPQTRLTLEVPIRFVLK